MEHLISVLAQYGLLLVFGNVLLAAVAGSLVGDLPWYAAGRMAGYRVLRTLCRISIEPDSCVKQTETTFER